MASNPFETGARKVIPAVLVYTFRSGSKGPEILMLHRNAGPRSGGEVDYHSGKWNGLGGKFEADESPLETARRELREESGLDLPEAAFQPLGVLTFPNFKAHKNEDWHCTVWVADVPESLRDFPVKGPEGDLHWVESDRVAALPLWAGDRYFIAHVVSRQPFFGTIWYRGQDVVRHWIQRI